MPRVVEEGIQESSWIHLRGLRKSIPRRRARDPPDYSRVQKGDISARECEGAL